MRSASMCSACSTRHQAPGASGVFARHKDARFRFRRSRSEALRPGPRSISIGFCACSDSDGIPTPALGRRSSREARSGERGLAGSLITATVHLISRIPLPVSASAQMAAFRPSYMSAPTPRAPPSSAPQGFVNPICLNLEALLEDLTRHGSGRDDTTRHAVDDAGGQRVRLDRTLALRIHVRGARHRVRAPPSDLRQDDGADDSRHGDLQRRRFHRARALRRRIEERHLHLHHGLHLADDDRVRGAGRRRAASADENDPLRLCLRRAHRLRARHSRLFQHRWLGALLHALRRHARHGAVQRPQRVRAVPHPADALARSGHSHSAAAQIFRRSSCSRRCSRASA